MALNNLRADSCMPNASSLLPVVLSWHSALIAEYLIEELAPSLLEVEYASEFRYHCNPILDEHDVVIAISLKWWDRRYTGCPRTGQRKKGAFGM